MRVAQLPEQPAHPPEPKLGRPLGHAEPLVIEPTVEVIKAVLVIVGHGVRLVTSLSEVGLKTINHNSGRAHEEDSSRISPTLVRNSTSDIPLTR